MKKIKAISTTIFAALIIMALSVVTFTSFQASAALYRQMEIGMSGSDVTELQQYLASDSSIYPEGLVTGYYGPLTRSAVMRFQARYGIPQVGRVGPQTLAALSSVMTGGSPIGGMDRIAPTITGVNIQTSNSSATISWNTSESAAAIVYYSTAAIQMTEASATGQITVSGIPQLVQTSLTTSHATTLTGLQPNTTYNYVIYVRDGSGNVSITWPATFSTQS